LSLPRAKNFLSVCPSLSLVTIPILEYFELSGICCGGSVILVVYYHFGHYVLMIFSVIPFTLHYN
jgi:hypothetical protein